MKLDVTRDVVMDLWSLCEAGAATTDSRALVDAFLAADPGFAETLRASERLVDLVPPVRLSPDAERRILDDARRRARMKLMIVGGAVAMGGLLLLVALLGAVFVMFGLR